jgi:hypothetical protein
LHTSQDRTRIPLEQAFSDFVKHFGGQIVSEIPGYEAKAENADYFFQANSVIAELKCLEMDVAENANIKSKIQTCIDRWADLGLIPQRYGLSVMLKSNDLPEQCRHELFEIYRRPLQRRLTKANRQIKQTAVDLGLNDFRGLLLVANNGNFGVDPNLALYLIWRTLGNRFSQITNVVFFTANMFFRSALTTKPTLVWIDVRRTHLQTIDLDFLARLRDGWFRHYEKLTGVPVEPIEGSEQDFSSMRFL